MARVTRLVCLLAFSVCCVRAVAAQRLPSVLFLYSFSYSDVVDKLRSTGTFKTVDVFDVQHGTPTLATLLPYDAVLLNDGGYKDGAAVGNVLADYVDAGGGVVVMSFACGGPITENGTPKGRWNPDYRVMNPVGGYYSDGHHYLDFSTVTQPNHSIFIGVQSFDGGADSRRCVNATAAPGASVLAYWTDGNIFVAEGPLPGRVDLNFFPLSQDSLSTYWQTRTDGIKLMANSLLRVMRPRVLLVAADQAPASADVRTKLRATRRFGFVDIFDAGSASPTLAALQQYDAVLVWGSLAFQSPGILGNTLADFADSGGGVVLSTGFDPDPAKHLGGRWASGAFGIIPAGNAAGPSSLGTLAYPHHPILAGVSSFDGGVDSFRPGANPLNARGLAVAKWADGSPLAAISTVRPNRVDLGFYPPSSDAVPNSWVSSGDGGRLLANAIEYSVKPYIACVAADPANMADVVDKLAASRRFSGVAAFDVSMLTPTHDDLAPFGAVLTWSFVPYHDPVAFGEALAGFVDSGGGVVTGMMANIGGLFDARYHPGGRWISEGFEIVPSDLLSAPKSGTPAFMSAASGTSAALKYYVRKFFGGSASLRPDQIGPMRGRSALTWSDGRMLAAIHNTLKRVDLGMYPPSDSTTVSGWSHGTDGTVLLANAIEHAARLTPCPGDFNGDGLVDDSDFVIFIPAYEQLINPRADLTGDGLSDDADFQSFVAAYNALECP